MIILAEGEQERASGIVTVPGEGRQEGRRKRATGTDSPSSEMLLADDARARGTEGSDVREDVSG